ncbi:MAG: cytochrome c [Vicinamibacterales bacterium]
MTRIRVALVAAAILAAASTMRAGGWAVITLQQLPDLIQAGQTVPLTFTVRQHGVTPLGGLSPRVEASAGGARVSAAAVAGPQTGQYTANLTLPNRGEWSITIHSGFGNSKLTLLPVTAVDSNGLSRAAAPSPIELGRHLFVAKGCVTCHSNALNTPNDTLNVGPVLIAKKYRDEFLARVLENPSATLPPSRLTVGAMPNLNLLPKEIAALVAFINEGMPSVMTAQRQR